MTLLDIRKDLKTIKYYYAMKNVFDRNSKELMPRKIVETVHKYGKAINDSEGELYVFYTELYVNGATQTDLADYLGVTRECVSRRHKKLIQYLQDYFNKEVIS